VSAPNTYRGSVVRAESVVPFQPETSREEPASQRPRNSSVPSDRPTQKWGSTRLSCPVISRLGQGAEHEANSSGSDVFWSERKPVSNQRARDQGRESLAAPQAWSKPQAMEPIAQTHRLNPGCPVRRRAHWPPSVKRPEIGSSQRLSPFGA
jgi:hypothetical protein